jgi:hypothetical protein
MAKIPIPKWGYEGHLEITPFSFSNDDKGEISNTLVVLKQRKETIALLLEDLEKQISLFKAYDILETEQPRRSEVLAALTALDAHAEPLAAMLQVLDSSTRYGLALHLPAPDQQADEPDWYTDRAYRDYVEFIRHALLDLLHAIDQMRLDNHLLAPSSGGRPKQLARRTFARNVAIIFANHTGALPAATKGDHYQSILRTCLIAATGVPIEDVHELACEVLRALKEEEPPLK